ncbi:RIP metalloprotease RseP [Methylophaga pinxianii]|uniref:RIP metalloprotease RseP n=1 Tax=Methylophaga pinxianii TaxID=2881052 RepID=UPI001CF5780B|nr:RIP metalloprotease RseP [Methylophaga pinxianii]MCB2428432.1 RIP metalloprotease RseP [Methylophaga pinxianii]UPH45368.1 RIP metalloprotease RseP [Methylophaga pinxianii]
MQSLIFFIIALSLLVVIHEFGHYWVARRCGVKVLRFSVGFGQKLWSKQLKNGTEFVIAALPLGGYVKMLDEREGPVADADLNQTFNRQSLRNRVAIVSAGPIANLLFAVFAYWAILVMGVPGIKPIIAEVTTDSPASQAELYSGETIIAVNGKATPTVNSLFQQLLKLAQDGETITLTTQSTDVETNKQLTLPRLGLDDAGSLFSQLGIKMQQPDMPPVLGNIVADSPAEQAGLLAGDELISADGERLSSWQSWVSLIQRHADQPIAIEILRNGQMQSLTITPTADENGVGRIGAAVNTEAFEIPAEWQAELRYGPFAAVPQAVIQTWQFSVTTLSGLWGMLVGTVSSDNLGGPIAIAQFAGDSAQQGLIAFMSFLAMISISLGILNLLPVPVLDGGHLLMYFFEWVRGKPLPESVQIQAQKIGLFLILLLMVFAFTNDIARLIG